MDALAGGAGGKTNSTVLNSTAALTTMVSQMTLGNGTQSHPSPTVPPCGQKVGHNHPKRPIHGAVAGTRRVTSLSYSGSQPTPAAQIRNSLPKVNKNSQGTTGKTKGKYATREVKQGHTPAPAMGRSTAHKHKRTHPTRTRKWDAIGRKSKWRQHTNDYLRDDDWELSQPFMEQTSDTALSSSSPLSALEPTPSFPIKTTASSYPEPTPSLLTSASSEPTRVPVPNAPEHNCPPPIERPKVTFLKRDNSGAFHLKLDNSREFIERCQPTVYRVKGGENHDHKDYPLLSSNLTTNNTGFQVSRENIDYSHHQSPEGDVTYAQIDTITLCKNNPALHRHTSWLLATKPGSQVYQDKPKTITHDTPPLQEAYEPFEWWYANSSEYESQDCEEKYEKMRFELLNKCPVAMRSLNLIGLQLLKPFDANNSCYADHSFQPPTFMINRQDAYTIVCAVNASCEQSPFRYPFLLFLHCRPLQQYGIWDDGYLTVSLSRPTHREQQKLDEASITIPIQKHPEIEAVEWDKNHKQLTIRLGDQPLDCLNVVVTTTPVQRSDGTSTDAADERPPEQSQVFLCTNPDQQISVPMAQSGKVLISFIPSWQVGENFSLKKPDDKGAIEQAEHVLAYCDERARCGPYHPHHQTPPSPSLPFKVCTGRCRTQFLPAALTKAGNITVGPCPSTTHNRPEPNPSPSYPDRDGQSPPIWIMIPMPVAAYLGFIGCWQRRIMNR